MDPLIGGALISGASSLLGGLFGKSSQEKANRENIKLQREFAQNGIQWKVADAKAAGLHPLAALGAQTASFSPSIVGDTSFGTGVAQAGQDLGRAIQSTRTQDQRVGAYEKTVQDLTLQRMGLENTLLASQISKANQPATGPAMPSAAQRWLVDGQGQTSLPASPVIPVERGALVSDQPLQRTNADPSFPSREPGALTDVGFARMSSGGYSPVPSADVKQRIEDDFFNQLQWNIRNKVLPTFGYNESPPGVELPRGKKWRYDPFRDGYFPMDVPY